MVLPPAVGFVVLLGAACLSVFLVAHSGVGIELTTAASSGVCGG
jgi:hypothetical protein